MSHPNPACLRSVSDLSSFIDRRPRAAWALAWRGQTELLLRRYSRALSDLDRALALNPRDAWARLWRGEALRRLGRCREAEPEFRRALRLDPSLTFARAALGYCFLWAGKDAAAAAELSRSLAAQPRCAPARAWRAEALFRLGRFKEAVADWQAALALHPQDQWVRRWLWRAKARLGDWNGALEDARALLEGHGARSPESRAAAAWLAERAGEAAEARAHLAYALEASHPLALRLSRGEKLSLACVERLLFRFDPHSVPPGGEPRGEISETDAPGLIARGWSELSRGNGAGAIEDASRALDQTLDPDRAAGLWLRAQAKKSAGDARAAAEDLARLRRLYGVR